MPSLTRVMNGMAAIQLMEERTEKLTFLRDSQKEQRDNLVLSMLTNALAAILDLSAHLVPQELTSMTTVMLFARHVRTSLLIPSIPELQQPLHNALTNVVRVLMQNL